MWYKLEFRCDLTKLVAQHTKIAEMGYLCMLGPESTVWVNDKDESHRTFIWLSLNTTECTITEYKDFQSLMKGNKIVAK